MEELARVNSANLAPDDNGVYNSTTTSNPNDSFPWYLILIIVGITVLAVLLSVGGLVWTICLRRKCIRGASNDSMFAWSPLVHP